MLAPDFGDDLRLIDRLVKKDKSLGWLERLLSIYRACRQSELFTRSNDEYEPVVDADASVDSAEHDVDSDSMDDEEQKHSSEVDKSDDSSSDDDGLKVLQTLIAARRTGAEDCFEPA